MSIAIGRRALSSFLLGFVILSGLSIPDTIAQSPGTFVITGSMMTSRTGHTATLLRDGRVLIAGGAASAELYDPSTGIFAPTGGLTTPRAGHTATLLADGRVLIAGGNAGAGTAELYDPVTGTFARTGDMAGSHEFPAANLLSSGKVLITGYPSAELYDPTTGVFTLTGQADNYGSNTAAILEDGRVLIAGTGGVSLYGIKADSLNLESSLPGSYAFQTTTLLGNGQVLIAGGEGGDYDRTRNEASLYDPRSGTQDGTGLLLFSRDGHTATMLPGGHVLIVGGYDGDGYDTGVPNLQDTEEYNPSTGSFTFAGSLVYLRDGHTATLLADGRVLIAGGAIGNPIVELYIPPLRAASAASLGGPIAPGSLGSLFGSRLANTTVSADPHSPSISLAGIYVRLTDSSGTDRFAPLLYVSPTQVNFEVPAGIVPGPISLEIDAPAEIAKTVAQIRNIAPGLFVNADDTPIAYVLRFEPDGTETVLSARNTIVLDDRPVYLILYATGIRNRSSLTNVQCSIGGIGVSVEYAGPEGTGIPGLDQVNLRLMPALKGLGIASLVLTVDGAPSNTVSVDIR